jgi:hypothetical protein
MEAEEKKEKRKSFGYYLLDAFIGLIFLGFSIAIVVAAANGFINLINKWFPKLKKQT